jgi:hypothetical protein
LNYGLERPYRAPLDESSLSPEMVGRVMEDAIPLERTLAFAALFTGISAVVTALSALADSMPKVRALLSWTTANETYFQAGGLLLACAWLIYAWRAYRQMAHARDQLIRAQLVDHWLERRDRESSKT